MDPVKLIARDTGLGMLSFETMKAARKLKSELKKLTTNDSAYYAVLARFELGHFDQIATVALEKQKEPAAYAKEVMNTLQMEINAASWAAAESAPVEPAKGKKSKSKLFMKFNSEEAFHEIRDHLRILGAPGFYDQTLKQFNYTQASDIPTHEAGIPVYKALCVERNRIQMERETLGKAAKVVGPERARDLMNVFREAHDKLGAGTFFQVLDEFGCPTIDIALASYDLEKILAKFLQISEERKRGKF